MLLDDWQSRGVAFVTLGEGIDTSTPAGRLVAGVLGSIAEFERARIQERIMAGLARAKAQGKRIGRPRATPLPTNAAAGLTVRQAAAAWGVSKSTAARRLRARAAPDVGQPSAKARSSPRFRSGFQYREAHPRARDNELIDGPGVTRSKRGKGR